MGFVSTCNPDLEKELLVLYLFSRKIILCIPPEAAGSVRGRLNLCLLLFFN